jgi:hypothetical protein
LNISEEALAVYRRATGRFNEEIEKETEDKLVMLFHLKRDAERKLESVQKEINKLLYEVSMEGCD